MGGKGENGKCEIILQDDSIWDEIFQINLNVDPYPVFKWASLEKKKKSDAMGSIYSEPTFDSQIAMKTFIGSDPTFLFFDNFFKHGRVCYFRYDLQLSYPLNLQIESTHSVVAHYIDTRGQEKFKMSSWHFGPLLTGVHCKEAF